MKTLFVIESEFKCQEDGHRSQYIDRFPTKSPQGLT